MKSTWTGLILCAVVIYFGIVHSMSNPALLLNSHALILVMGGTVAISFLTYSRERLGEMMNYIIHGFLFRMKQTERVVAKDLISHIDMHYKKAPTFELSKNPHPFMLEASRLLSREEFSVDQLESAYRDRRNSIKRKYIEDAKILNNIAKYPPHLGLLGAASGMIQMMSGLGKDGIDIIGASMAVALTATLWGVGLNNFVFLPLADNSMKVSEDEVYLRDIMIDCFMLMKRGKSYEEVVRACFNKLSLKDRLFLRAQYKERQFGQKRSHDVAA